MKPQMIAVSDIRLDGGTQPRASIDYDVVAEYAAEMSEGITFPPVDVFFDGVDYWLGNGFHRLHAANHAGLTRLCANVHRGDIQAARDFACGTCNATHGLRETVEDRHRRIQIMIQDHSDWSNRRLADHCGVSDMTVARVKKESDFNNVEVR